MLLLLLTFCDSTCNCFAFGDARVLLTREGVSGGEEASLDAGVARCDCFCEEAVAVVFFKVDIRPSTVVCP